VSDGPSVPFEARVLAADDNATNRDAIVRALRRARFEVVETDSGREALRLAHAQRPDVVLLDPDLRDLTGFEVCRHLRADDAFADTAILHLSATLRDPQDRVHGLEQGADAFLNQPVDEDELVAIVRALLRARRPDRRARVRAPLTSTGEAQLELMRVLGAAPLPLALVDRLLQCTWCNPRFLALGGRTSRDEHVIPLADLLPTALGGALAAEARRVLETGFEAMVGLPDATPGVYWRAHLVPVGPGARDGVVCSILEPLDVRVRRLDGQLRARDSLLVTAASGLRDPLDALAIHMSSIAGLLATGSRADAEERVRAAQGQLGRLQRMLGRLGAAARAAPLTPQDLDLAELVRAVVAAHESAASAAGCEVRVRANGDTRGTWDLGRLEQVIANLLDNALRHAPGQPVDVSVDGTPSGVRLVVRDRGPGLNADLRDRLAHPAERPAAGRSIGLGLWIVREAVDAHGGGLRVDPLPPGQGAAIVVELPRSCS
jgi:signal transduction histidine kinase